MYQEKKPTILFVLKIYYNYKDYSEYVGGSTL